MPATAAWLASAESVFNRSIGASGQAMALARRLQGTSLQVEVAGITRIRAAVCNGRLGLLAGDDSPADAVILGTASALLQLLNSAAPQNQPRAQQRAQIRGDAEIANLYRELFMLARPDAEEELSRFIGDLPARAVTRFAQGVATWVRRTRRVAGENIAEYLQEESRDLVNQTELEEFLRGVDGARESADRIEARLKLLEQHPQGVA